MRQQRYLTAILLAGLAELPRNGRTIAAASAAAAVSASAAAAPLDLVANVASVSTASVNASVAAATLMYAAPIYIRTVYVLFTNSARGSVHKYYVHIEIYFA